MSEIMERVAEEIRGRVQGVYGFVFWGIPPVQTGDQLFPLVDVQVTTRALTIVLRHEATGTSFSVSISRPQGCEFKDANTFCIAEADSIEFEQRERRKSEGTNAPALELIFEPRKQQAAK